jgi:hypothetical protein
MIYHTTPSAVAYQAVRQSNAGAAVGVAQQLPVRIRDCSKIGVSGPTRRAEVRRDGHCE